MNHDLLWAFLSICLSMLKSLYSHKNDKLVNKCTGAVNKLCKLFADMFVSIYSIIIVGPGHFSEVYLAIKNYCLTQKRNQFIWNIDLRYQVAHF